MEDNDTWVFEKYLLYMHKNHDLSKYTVHVEWIQSVIDAKSNEDLLKALLNNKLFSKIIDIYKDELTNECPSIDKICQDIVNECEQVFTQDNSILPILSVFVILISIFLKDNCGGPSFFGKSQTEDDELMAREDLQQYNILLHLEKQCKDTKLQNALQDKYSKDGEEIYIKTRFLYIFHTIITTINFIETKSKTLRTLELWKARTSILHNRILSSNVVHLQDSSINHYLNFIDALKNFYSKEDSEYKDLMSLVNVEYSYCLLTFYKYNKAEDILKDTEKILGIKLELTGKMGKKSKYQEDNVAQLILDVKGENVEIKEINEAENITNLPKNVNLEEDSILYEKPKLEEEEEKKTEADPTIKKELNVYEQIYVEAYINFIVKTNPKDELLSEQIFPYIQKVLEKPLNWLIFSNGLLLRSRNEANSTKRKERSVLQTQHLVDQFNDTEPGFLERVQYYWCTNYPLIWDFKHELATNFMSIGVFMSAFELFKDLEMHEKCVECLFISGKTTQAENLAKEILEKKQIPGVLCLLGDIKRDESYYVKAWEVSNGKFARAMRSLGRIHFFKEEYKEATECYEKALKINPLFADSWFTMACAYMRLENWQKALYAFGRVVDIDENQGEAWCNMATSYVNLGRRHEALLCLEQALKKMRENWKIWENFLIMSLETNDFNRSLRCFNELIRLNLLSKIGIKGIAKLCEIFIVQYYDKKETENVMYELNKKKMYDLFEKFTGELAKSYDLWRIYGKFIEAIELNEKKTPEEFIKTYENLIDVKMKECRSHMVINWEKDIDASTVFEKSIIELIELLQKARPFVKPNSGLKYFVLNNKKKIEGCLYKENIVIPEDLF